MDPESIFFRSLICSIGLWFPKEEELAQIPPQVYHIVQRGDDMSEEKLFDYLAELETENRSREEIEEQAYARFGKNLALVCMDSTGFSRTVKKRGIVYYLSLIAKMREIASTCAEACHAISYRSYADNFFAEFATVQEAVQMSIMANQEVRKAGLRLSRDEPYQLCTGIGYGHVLFAEKDGPFGDQMNLASKLGEDTAEGEEILLTPEALAELPASQRTYFEERTFEISGLHERYFHSQYRTLAARL